MNDDVSGILHHLLYPAESLVGITFASVICRATGKSMVEWGSDMTCLKQKKKRNMSKCKTI